jgi:hypothetical protein
MEYIVVFIIIAIVVVLWLLLGSTKSRCISKLNGMWMADEEFCNESGIELMTIYFGDCPAEIEEAGVNAKLCWILIINNKGDYNHITIANISEGKKIKSDQYEFKLDLKDSPDNMFSTNLIINIVPDELITIIDPDTDIKVFEGTKNKEASEAIEFSID